MHDNRREDRVLVLQTGRIRCGDQERPIDCAILNVSSTGACILVPIAQPIPESFDLVIDSDRSAHPCMVAWRRGARIGVEFKKAATAAQSTPGA